MKKFLARYYVIVILILLFAAPGISAWYFFKHPELLGKASTNKGQLFNLPVQMHALEKSTKWHLIFWIKNACDDQCMQQLDKLAKIRLALGRKLYEVDLDLVLAEDALPLPKNLVASIKERGFRVTRSVQSFLKKSPVLIASPDGYLILGFAKEANPADIFHDLKQLLSNPNVLNQGAKN